TAITSRRKWRSTAIAAARPPLLPRSSRSRRSVPRRSPRCSFAFVEPSAAPDRFAPSRPSHNYLSTIADIPIVIGFLSGEPRQGRMKIGGAVLAGVRDVPPADDPTLDLVDVDRVFDRLAGLSGAGSASSRSALLRDLFGRATSGEQDFLSRLLFGELRQGALEGVLTDAVARAAGIQAGRVRRATMLAGDLAAVAQVALVDGDAALSQFVLRPFQPVQPMLAETAADVADALAELGEASFEYKLDGARN